MFKIFKSNTNITTFNQYLNFISNHLPIAKANILGNRNNSNVRGKVDFFQTNLGVLVVSEIENLPENQTGNFFAMHIHDADDCQQDENGNFLDSTHFNPQNYSHPFHAGDLPVILSNDGLAFSVVLTKRFNVSDIIGKTIFIHENADDFRTDPSGNSGVKIACGVIEKV